MPLSDHNKEQLQQLSSELQSELADIKAAGLSLDLTRGKPAPEQLDLSNAMDGILDGFYLLQDGTDVRNYGGILGIPEARELGAALMDIQASQVLAGGNSSLSLMYAYVDMAMNKGAAGPGTAWSKEGQIKFLCPVPGYDRHFTICEHFGIEMINVDMGDDGPDMDQIEALVAADPLIKGIWCVPKYSNPTGIVYSDETVSRFARLARLAGPNFRIMWDNAYAVHHLDGAAAPLKNLMSEAEALGTEDSVVMLASTSKITFAGAGVAFLGTSSANLAQMEKFLTPSVIGFDKVNQLRHVRFFEADNSLADHMDQHQQILKPKFDRVQTILSEELSGLRVAEWTEPTGGYFVSLDVMPGLASRIIQLAGEAGVKLTPAGSTYPYKKDPEDRNIRIAPTFPKIEDLDQAMRVLTLCVKLASTEKLLAQ